MKLYIAQVWLAVDDLVRAVLCDGYGINLGFGHWLPGTRWAYRTWLHRPTNAAYETWRKERAAR